MILNILANTTGLVVSLIVIVAYAFIFAVVIICLIRVSRYFLTAGKEQKLMRIEIGKLAEEIHLIRQKLEGEKEKESSAESVCSFSCNRDSVVFVVVFFDFNFGERAGLFEQFFNHMSLGETNLQHQCSIRL